MELNAERFPLMAMADERLAEADRETGRGELAVPIYRPGIERIAAEPTLDEETRNRKLKPPREKLAGLENPSA